MPLRHVVMFTWADHVTADHVERVGAALDRLPSVVESIRNYVHGPDVGVSDGNFEYVVVADFDDVAGYETYRDHPEHVSMIQDLVAGNVERRAAVQYET